MLAGYRFFPEKRERDVPYISYLFNNRRKARIIQVYPVEIPWESFVRQEPDPDKYLFLGIHPTVEYRAGGRYRMSDPELHSDEKILIRTQAVQVKSISFEAILTNKRIILVDRLKNLLPPKEIPLATIQSLAPGENAVRDPTIILGVVTKSGETRQMLMTFSREGGGNRSKERDEWVRRIEMNLTPSFEQVIRKVIPGIDSRISDQPGTLPPQTSSPQRPDRQPQKVSPAQKTWEKSLGPQPPAPEAGIESVLGTYCTRCGTRVPEGSGFCTKCGSPLATLAAPAQPPAAPAPEETLPEKRLPGREIPVVSSRESPTLSFPVIRPPPESSAPAGQEPSGADRPAKPPGSSADSATKNHGIPRLFSPRDLPPTPLVPSSMPTAGSPLSPGKPSSKKKILIVAGIIVIILIIAVAGVVVLPKLGSSATHSSGSPSAGSATTTTTTAVASTSSTGSSAGSTSTAVVVATSTPADIPSTGVAVSVSYIGGFKGSYSANGNITSISNSGNKVYEIDNATGLVSATFQKTDGTATHALTVGIYNNGNMLVSKATNASYGTVTVSTSV